MPNHSIGMFNGNRHITNDSTLSAHEARKVPALTSNNTTWKNNIVSLLHRSDRCSIYVASPTIQNNRILRQNCGGGGKKRKRKGTKRLAGNISSDAIIMIRSVVHPASRAIEFSLKVETFSIHHPRKGGGGKKEVKKVLSARSLCTIMAAAQTSWKHIHSINFNVEALLPPLLILSSHSLGTKSWKIIFGKFVIVPATTRAALTKVMSIYSLITVKLKRKLIVWLVWKSTRQR